MTNGVCAFCAPLSVSGTPAVNLHPGWTGFDRDLGARRREEEALRAHAEQRQRDDAVRSPGSAGSVIAILVALGVSGWLWQSGALSRVPALFGTGARFDLPSIGGLPTELSKPPSAARQDLAFLGRNLVEFESDAEHKFTNCEDVTNAVVERYRDRLHVLKADSRALEPRLTREETRVLFAFEHAESMLDSYLVSFEGNAPDTDGAQARAALEQIQRALTVARGGHVENLMMVYERRNAESRQLQRELQAE
jgi:hypothetical protein